MTEHAKCMGPYMWQNATSNSEESIEQPERMRSAHPASSAKAGCCCRVSGGCMSSQTIQMQLGKETCQSPSLNMPLSPGCMVDLLP